MRIACLVTGAPRTFRRCAPTLRHYLSQHEVDFFIVYRDDNVTPMEERDIAEIYRPKEKYITTTKETAAIEGKFPHADANSFRMWHEVAVGGDLIEPVKDRYDLFIRTRFDCFFLRHYIDIKPEPNTVIVPDCFSFTGINDMHCEADWGGFSKYTRTYHFLSDLLHACKGISTPELRVLQSLDVQGAEAREKVIHMTLLRPWFESFSDAEFEEMICNEHSSTLLKYAHYTEAHDAEIETMRQRCARSALFPLGPNPSHLWYPAEIDQRDGKPFRWFRNQAYFYRCIEAGHERFTMIIHFYVRHWPLENLRIFFGPTCAELMFSKDEAGRSVVSGDIPRTARGRFVKVALLYNYTIVPAQAVQGSTDKRVLSMAVSPMEFHNGPSSRFRQWNADRSHAS